MKKHYKLTPAEREQHDKAVKLRHMTDEQLVQYINDQQGSAYERGLKTHDEIENTSEGCFKQEVIEGFILQLSSMSNTGNGLGPATVAKLRKFAREEGYING